ncbi:MAG: hypothetical protein R3F65_09950 [bacterium]
MREKRIEAETFPRPRPAALLAGGLLGLLVSAAPVTAAEITDVIDAADGDDPFDMRIEVDYRRSLRRAKITREFNCQPSTTPEHIETCPEAPPEGELLHVKELRYERVTHEVVPTVRIGLWHDLELKVEIPIVANDEQTLRFAGNGGDPDSIAITPAESTIAPADREHLFDVPPDLPKRAGFGDMLFMIRYSPFAQERDDLRATWTLELGYRAPTGDVMKYNNEAVGRGVHELIVATALSHRFEFAEPYARFDAVFPFASQNALFKDYGDGQQHVGPGARTGFLAGAELVPYDDPKRGVKFFIDVGLGAEYQAEGRDYSELFDALGGASVGRAPEDACAIGTPYSEAAPNCPRYNPDSRSRIADTPIDGLTTVEEHITFKGKLGFGMYLSRFAKIGVTLQLDHDTEHYLSNADVGRDLDGSGLVEARGAVPNADGIGGYDPEEHNPTYIPAIDAVGRRIRVEETTVFHLGANLSLVF